MKTRRFQKKSGFQGGEASGKKKKNDRFLCGGVHGGIRDTGRPKAPTGVPVRSAKGGQSAGKKKDPPLALGGGGEKHGEVGHTEKVGLRDY